MAPRPGTAAVMITRKRNRPARWLAPLAVVALTLGATACSDDDGEPDDLDNPVDGVDDNINDVFDTTIVP